MKNDKGRNEVLEIDFNLEVLNILKRIHSHWRTSFPVHRMRR